MVAHRGQQRHRRRLDQLGGGAGALDGQRFRARHDGGGVEIPRRRRRHDRDRGQRHRLYARLLPGVRHARAHGRRDDRVHGACGQRRRLHLERRRPRRQAAALGARDRAPRRHAGRRHPLRRDILSYYNVSGEWILRGLTGAPGIPLGVALPYFGVTAPASAFALPFGQAISRTTYVNLFNLVASTYGAGDGATTFNLPDLRGYLLAGKDDMGGAAASRITAGASGIDGTVLGAAGGAQTVTLITAQMPAHGHGVSDPTHAHAVSDPSHGPGVP